MQQVLHSAGSKTIAAIWPRNSSTRRRRCATSFQRATTNFSNTSGITPLLGMQRAGRSSSPHLSAGLANPTRPSSAQPW
jgi:hypothetical protein